MPSASVSVSNTISVSVSAPHPDLSTHSNELIMLDTLIFRSQFRMSEAHRYWLRRQFPHFWTFKRKTVVGLL